MLTEAVAIAAFAVLLAIHAWRTLGVVNGATGVAALLTAGILAALAADLGSGLAHWFCDTFFAEDTPVIGPALILPFRAHHHDPLAITRRGFLEVNSYNCFVMVPPLAAAWWGDGPAGGSPLATFGAGFLLFLAPAVVLTNQIHQWAHAASARAAAVPRPVRWAQRLRLVLPPDEHARHHAARAAAYCITTGWLNPPLDRLGILPAIERRLRTSPHARRLSE